MAENHKAYKKLPGRSAGLVLGANRLWYSDDHLIAVSSAYGYEKYQRFYFRDIAAFVVRRTKVRLIWNIIFGVIAAAIIIPVLSVTFYNPGTPFTDNMRIGVITVMVPATIALIGLIVNTAKGATCTFWVQTPGGMTKLDTPVRVRPARKVINILTPLIAQAQTEQSASASMMP